MHNTFFFWFARSDPIQSIIYGTRSVIRKIKSGQNSKYKTKQIECDNKYQHQQFCALSFQIRHIRIFFHIVFTTSKHLPIGLSNGIKFNGCNNNHFVIANKTKNFWIECVILLSCLTISSGLVWCFCAVFSFGLKTLCE